MASVDLVARLVDSAVFSGLCKVPAVQLADALSKGELRTRRPEEIANLDRAFDIDAEAEFLDWFDGHQIGWTDAGFLSDLSNAKIPRDDAAEGLRLLSELASPGSFRCWEGRMMLYLDVLLEREIRDIDDLYSDQTWLDAIGAVDRSDAVGFSEDVVMRWIRTCSSTKVVRIQRSWTTRRAVDALQDTCRRMALLHSAARYARAVTSTGTERTSAAVRI